MQEEIITQLAEVGLTRNEALAFLTLLEDNSAEGLTGYEVAARSGIPRSAVYAVLRKLEVAGAAFPTGAEPVRYLPTDPKRFLAQSRQTALAAIDRAEEALSRLPPRATPEPIWVLSRYEEVMSRIDAMIRGASHSLYLSLWSRELSALMPALRSLNGRKLHRVLHSPDAVAELPLDFHAWVDDVTGDTEKARWSHKALVVVDHAEALIGGAEPDADNHAVWTSNPSLVDVATNHVILDVTLLSQRTGRSCSETVIPMIRPHLPKR